VDDANLIYQGSEDLCVRVWDIREKSTIPAVHITGYIYFPLCMHIQNDGNTLATGCKGFNSVGCGVTLWDVRNTAKPLNEFKGHSQDVTGCQFHPSNGRWLASVSKDGSVIIWDIHDSVCVGEYQFPKKWISSLTLGDCSNKNGEVSLEVIVGSLDGSISVLNFTKSEGLKLSFESKGMDQPVNEIS
jgi:WD40 repeat protein